MYGLIGKMIAAPGKRDEFIAILVEGIGNMPGCLSYIVATDPADANAIWITEVVGQRGESRRVAVAAASEGSHRQGPAVDCRLRRTFHYDASRRTRVDRAESALAGKVVPRP